jgi:ABC-2 type transport system ATP-binding protein
MLHDPEILFLDEPTIGLDPQTRLHIWEYVDELRHREKTTMFLTTHYMDEAERLCDRVAIVDQGKVIALGTPRELIASLGGEHVVDFTLANNPSEPPPADGMLDDLRRLTGVTAARREASAYSLSVTEPHVALPALLDRLRARGLELASLTTRHASLEDVFVALTGRHLREEGPSQ